MGKGHFLSIIGVVTILLLPLAMAQSVVNMGGVVILDDLDLGIEGGDVSPSACAKSSGRYQLSLSNTSCVMHFVLFD